MNGMGYIVEIDAYDKTRMAKKRTGLGRVQHQTGEVLGKTTRHTSAEFVAFLNGIVANQPPGKERHVIADNLSAHEIRQVSAFLAEHPTVHMHFTPTYSSWLNQVELWFASIERDVIARGVFTSLSDLKRSSCAISASTTSNPSR